MTTLGLAAGQAAVLDTDAWLDDFLTRHARQEFPFARDADADRLRAATFVQVVSAIERAGHTPGDPATIQIYQHWIANQPPASAHLHAAWFNLGVAFTMAQDQTNAILAYQNALRLRPDFHAAAMNLGNVLESVGQPQEALLTWERGLQPNEARINLFNNRARLLEKLGRLKESEQELRQSLLLDPNQPDVIQHRIHIRQKMCAWPPLTDDIPGLSKGDLLRHAGPMAALALTDDIATQREAGRDWIKRKTSPVPVLLSSSDGYQHDRIRIGYMSSDFCSHAMSYLITELFEQHDRSRFEVFGYCSSPDDGSSIRARVIRSFDHYKPIKHLSDEQAAQLISDDEIDILIDLNGLTSGVRPQILRWKPAPVQATYLGFVGPVPLPELDYMFCDQTVVPPHLASGYEPKPLYVASNYQANDSKRSLGEGTTRAAIGLPDDKFVLCCFSNHYKVTEDVFVSWMEILKRSVNAVLWLVSDNEWARRNMLDRAVQCGIDPTRIIFTPRVGPDDYMARLSLADLFLDTFPYNAGTVASDAIRMGLPMVTLSGQGFASRMATSLLAAIGAHQGVTTTLRDYIEFAVSMSNDEKIYKSYKDIFTPENWRVKIGDISGFTASYEEALFSIVKRGPSLNRSVGHVSAGNRTDPAPSGSCEQSTAAEVLASPGSALVVGQPSTQAGIVRAALTEHEERSTRFGKQEQARVLHVGCGVFAREKLPPLFREPGWQELRLDIDPAVCPDFVSSITDMSVISDGLVDAVYSSHNVEHLYPHEVPQALKEVRRVLKPSGFLLITLPDLQNVARHIAEGKLEDTLYLSPMGPVAPLDILYGHRPSLKQGNLFMAHHTGFTDNTLASALISAGFAAVALQRHQFALTAVAFRCQPGDEELATAQKQMAAECPITLYTSASATGGRG